MNYKNRALDAIELAIKKIEKHLETLYDRPIKHLPSEHILKFKDTLLKMKASIEENVLPNDYKPTLGKVIVDSWPYDSEIGPLIIAAEKKYYNHLKSLV